MLSEIFSHTWSPVEQLSHVRTVSNSSSNTSVMCIIAHQMVPCRLSHTIPEFTSMKLFYMCQTNKSKNYINENVLMYLECMIVMIVTLLVHKTRMRSFMDFSDGFIRIIISKTKK